MAFTQILLFPLLLAASVFGDGWLGVKLSEETDRPVISEVIPGSPAARVKLRPGDVILAVDGKRTRTVDALLEVFEDLKPGQVVRLGIQRGAKKMDLEVRLAARQETAGASRPSAAKQREPARGKRVPAPAPAGKPYLGVQIEQRRGGIDVIRVVENSPAARHGLRRGDRIRSFGERRMRNEDDLDAAMKRLHPGDRLAIVVLRGEKQHKLNVVLGARPGAAPRPGAESARPVPSKPAKPRRRVAVERPIKKATDSRPRPVDRPRQGVRPVSDNLAQTLARARRSGRPVFVVFGASWCVRCQTLKKSLKHRTLQGLLARYEQVWIDTDRQSALADKFDVEFLPHIVFMTSAGKTRKTLTGYQPAEILRPILAAGLKDSPKRTAPARRVPAKKVPAKRIPKKKAPAKKTPRRMDRSGVTPPPRRDRPTRVPPSPDRPSSDAAQATQQLQQVRREIQRLRREQRKQSALLQRILKELQKKQK